MRLPEAELQWYQSCWKTNRYLETEARVGRSESLDLRGVSLGSLEESTKHRDLLHPGSIVLAHSSSLHWLSGIEDAPGIQVEDPVFSSLSRVSSYLSLPCVHKSCSILGSTIWIVISALLVYFWSQVSK